MYFGPTDATLRISLDEVEPEVWRRLVVPSAILLPDLARVFEVTMGWGGYHLHQFVVADILFGAPDDDNDWSIDYRKVTLQQIARAAGSTLSREYDFGDGWIHTVRVEAIAEPDPGSGRTRRARRRRGVPAGGLRWPVRLQGDARGRGRSRPRARVVGW